MKKSGVMRNRRAYVSITEEVTGIMCGKNIIEENKTKNQIEIDTEMGWGWWWWLDVHTAVTACIKPPG